MRTLKLGSRGPDVNELQMQLNRCCHSSLDEDGNYGYKTKRAVIAFQINQRLLPDGEAGPQTRSALNNLYTQYIQLTPMLLSPTNDYYIDKIDSLKDIVDFTPDVVYGPGRGLCANNRWVITWGPGGVGLKKWKGDKKGPSFHCSSLVNFGLSYLINRNQDYTHAGNIPSLFDLAAMDNTLHQVAPGEPEKFRGYQGRLFRLASDGDTAKRNNFGWDKAYKYWDAEEINDHLHELPLITVWSMTTIKGNKFQWDHHVGFFIHYPGQETKLYRFAADGYVSKGKYSCTPIVFKEFGFAKGFLYQLFRLDLTVPLEHPEEYPIIVEI